MDKEGKLQRYNRKDYSEVVDFPVEIVGRDGVVRRYTFEDSIRLYQRRITFAPIRYRDTELVDAEVHHCRARIDQLRRSYFHRFGWGTPEGQPDAEALLGDLAGELAAFVCRVLNSPGRPPVRLERIRPEEDGVSVWFITPEGATAGMLVYVYRFVGGEDDPVRERFFDRLKALERMGPCEGDGERLLSFHHTVDCGFVLTARGSEHQRLMPARSPPEPSLPDPWEDVLAMIRRGAQAAALERCRALVREQPWHRRAYLAGAMLALSLEDYPVVEELALLGCRYFPHDGLLHYYLGSSRLQRGLLAEGEEALRRAIDVEPSLAVARLALVVSRLRDHDHRGAFALLTARVRSDDRRSDEVLERLESWLRWRRLTVWGGVGLAALGLGTVPISWLGVVPALCGASAAWIGATAFERQFRVFLQHHRTETVRRGLRRINRQTVSDPVVS